MSSSFEKKLVSRVHAIHEKPLHVRQMYALVVAGTATAGIVVVWVTAIIFAGYYPTMTPMNRAQLTATAQDSGANINLFKNEFAKQVQDSPAHDQVNQLLEQFKQKKEENAAAAAAYANSQATPNSAGDTSEDGTIPDTSMMQSDTTNINTNTNPDYGQNY